MGRNKVCAFCHLPGHKQAKCQTEIRCGFGSGKHSGRRCPETTNKPAIGLTFFENVTPIDNIDRHAFSQSSAVNFRSRSRNSERTEKRNVEQRSRMPTTHILGSRKTNTGSTLRKGMTLRSLTTLLSAAQTWTVPFRLAHKFMTRLL